MAPKLTLATPWSRWAWRHWLAAIGVLLVIGLAPLGWIQWQQLRLLNKVATNLYDPIQWYTYQMERELSRLEHAVTLARLDPAAADPQALHLRFEVFLSRAKMFTGPQPSAQLDNSNTHARVIAQLRDFGALADPLFAEPEKLLASPQQLALLDGRIRAMLPTLAEFTREANSIGARFLEQQNNQLRKQSVLVITLAAIQAAAMLGFVGLLVLHLQRQQQRYRELQALTSALEEARDQAEAANQSKTVFLANMSHEIRTPFQGLLGMLALLGESNLNQRQRDHLKTAHNSATHLLGVLNDVLDVATMASGTLRLMVAPVSLHSVVQAVDELMQIAARDKGLKLSVDAAGDLPEWVMADATRLRQMLYNLISNAIKFTSEGSVMVTLERAEPGQPSLVVKVLDTGIGMNEQTVDRLFDRFYQADSSLRRRAGGTGLGLPISRNLARMMGGDIRVKSRLGVGSVFTLSLDLAETRAPKAPHSSRLASAQSRSLRVLVAEDHPINLKYLSILLEKMGHDAVFCENGQEALQLLAHQPFDVVLLDYHMPVLDGLATTEAIRQLDDDKAQIPVILITADVANDTRTRALEAGVSAFASKPLRSEDLRRALHQCGLLTTGQAAPSDGDPAQPPPVAAQPPSQQHPRREQVIDDAAYDEIRDLMPEASMHKMLRTLFDLPEGTVPKLLAALDSGDRADIHFKAHTLKGTTMLLGLRALAKTSAHIEQLSKDASGPQLPSALSEQLLRDMQATQQLLFETAAPGAVKHAG